jgi:mannose-6-phosphate isomerase-like protein (cupin superfamily)
MSYTKKNLRDLDDVAAARGAKGFEARFGAGDLGCETTGFALETIHPGARTPFKHHHENAEEVYVVIAGSGTMALDNEQIDVGPLDAIRVAPQVERFFSAGDDGLEVLVFGPRHQGDGEITPHDD